MRATRAVIPFDSGWLFLLAGVTALSSCLLIPPQEQVHEMNTQLSALRAEERLVMARLRAYSDFLTALDDRDPQLVRRLAAAQLNLAREMETPVLVAGTAKSPVTEWIESSVNPEPVRVTEFPASHLATLVTGARRHWILAAAVGCLFAGLVIGSGTRSRTRRAMRGRRDDRPNAASDPDEELIDRESAAGR